METNQTRNITPERAREILAEKGVYLSLDKAARVLDFMRKMANLELTQNDK
jgi:hypothetical protein